jgi:hypothetical protein
MNEISFQKIEEKVQTLELGQQAMKLGHEQVCKDIKEIKDTLKEFIDSAGEKYAPRMAWDILRWAGMVCGGTIIVSFIGLLLKGNLS